MPRGFLEADKEFASIFRPASQAGSTSVIVPLPLMLLAPDESVRDDVKALLLRDPPWIPGTHGWVLIQKKPKQDNIFTKAIRRVSMSSLKSNWKKRYLVATGPVLCMFASERAFKKSIADVSRSEGRNVTIESRAKHVFHVDPSCTCAPAMTTNQGCFVITLPSLMQRGAMNISNNGVDRNSEGVRASGVADKRVESNQIICL